MPEMLAQLRGLGSPAPAASWRPHPSRASDARLVAAGEFSRSLKKGGVRGLLGQCHHPQMLWVKCGARVWSKKSQNHRAVLPQYPRTLIQTPVQSERRHLESLQPNCSLIPRRGHRPRFQVLHGRYDSNPPPRPSFLLWGSKTWTDQESAFGCLEQSLKT